MEPDTGVHHHALQFVFTHQDAALGIIGIVTGMDADALETGPPCTYGSHSLNRGDLVMSTRYEPSGMAV